jgi:hypothetical protein
MCGRTAATPGPSSFATGTTRVVAEVVQGSVECDDEALREAVDDALRQKPKAVAK